MRRFIAVRGMAWGHDSAADQSAMVGRTFAVVFVFAMLAQVLGAKPVEGSRSGNLRVTGGFAWAVIGLFVAWIAWVVIVLV